jgi:hypothetical protein
MILEISSSMDSLLIGLFSVATRIKDISFVSLKGSLDSKEKGILVIPKQQIQT